MLDCGNTRLYELLKNKELESYWDGRSRKIITASIHRYIAQRLKDTESTAAAAPVAAAARRGQFPPMLEADAAAAPRKHGDLDVTPRRDREPQDAG
jgi:hypothetical protein